jgi:kynurenine aminotransferase
MSATAARPDPFRPAKRVAGQRQDVWYAVISNLEGKY